MLFIVCINIFIRRRIIMANPVIRMRTALWVGAPQFAAPHEHAHVVQRVAQAEDGGRHHHLHLATATAGTMS